jgi:hypothetical protein
VSLNRMKEVCGYLRVAVARQLMPFWSLFINLSFYIREGWLVEIALDVRGC